MVPNPADRGRQREGLQCPWLWSQTGHSDYGDCKFGFLAKVQKPDCSGLKSEWEALSNSRAVKGRKEIR